MSPVGLTPSVQPQHSAFYDLSDFGKSRALSRVPGISATSWETSNDHPLPLVWVMDVLQQHLHHCISNVFQTTFSSEATKNVERFAASTASTVRQQNQRKERKERKKEEAKSGEVPPRPRQRSIIIILPCSFGAPSLPHLLDTRRLCLVFRLVLSLCLLTAFLQHRIGWEF